MERIFALVNFLALCNRGSVELRSIRGILNSGETISSFGVCKRGEGRITAGDWILTLGEIGGTFEDVLNGWFLLVRRLGCVGQVFFSELVNPSPVTDASFFHFAACLEAFHREVVHARIGKFLPKKEYKEMAKSLLDHLPSTVPEALKIAMQSSLSHANDHSFAERIDALFNALDPATQRCLTDEPKRFLAAIKYSRNKLAHVADGTDRETFEGREYAHANVSIRAWLTILMLKECGIPESLIMERMMAVGYFYWGPFKFDPR